MLPDARLCLERPWLRALVWLVIGRATHSRGLWQHLLPNETPGTSRVSPLPPFPQPFLASKRNRTADQGPSKTHSQNLNQMESEPESSLETGMRHGARICRRGR